MSAQHSHSHSAPAPSDDVSDLPFAPTLRKILVVMGIGFAVPIVVLLLIAYYIGSSSEPPAGSESLSPAAVDARVAPVGSAAVAASSQAAAQQNAASMSTAAAPTASATATAAAPAPAGSGAAAPAAVAKADGKALYESVCIACHGAGVAGAPKVGDKSEWAPIIAQGEAVLYDRAIHGYTGKRGVMPPKGGSNASDDAVKAAVDYMIAQSK